MPRILVINGSYRDDGITDRLLAAMMQWLLVAGAEVESVRLREYPIEFCLNCRHCTQQPGDAPGTCAQQDGMGELITRIEQADGYILASPTNCGAVTAVFKRFMERLAGYLYWPWNQPSPHYRKARAIPKKALLVSSCAAPGLFGRWLFGTRGQLEQTAITIGAKAVGILFTGQMGKELRPGLSPRLENEARAMAAKLVG